MLLDQGEHPAAPATSVSPDAPRPGGLAALVPYDAAWWGETSGGIDGLAPRNWLSGRVNLGADFAREWNRIDASDGFACNSMRQLDTVVWSHGFEDPVPEVEAFARRHDLHGALAITSALPGSGLLQFISPYRGEGQPPLEPAQRVVFRHFTAHLIQRWSARIAELVADSDRPSGDGQGLVDCLCEYQ